MTKHIQFIKTLPCIICGDSIQTQCAHVRYADPRIGKPESGIGRKPPDWFTVPLCNQHHRVQHEGNERDFWDWWGLDPHFISMSLFCYSGNYQQCCVIIQWHQYHSQRCLDLKIATK